MLDRYAVSYHVPVKVGTCCHNQGWGLTTAVVAAREDMVLVAAQVVFVLGDVVEVEVAAAAAVELKWEAGELCFPP